MGNVKHDVLTIKHFITKHFKLYFYVYCYLIHMNDRIIVVASTLIQRYIERRACFSNFYIYSLICDTSNSVRTERILQVCS
jgi:hypothetical protein